MIVDIYTHILPNRFFQELERGSPKLGSIGKRLRTVQKLFDLDLRFRDMDEIGDYRQIISLPNPPIEDIAEGEVAKNLASVANDAMAELCTKYPDRFPAFAAAVSMHDVDAAIAEIDRAIKMGARGVQTFTNIAGHPLDEPRFRPFFAAMAEHDLPIWLHPARTSSMPDYASEPRSRFEMWWCFGWPYETTVAMARLVFDGVDLAHDADAEVGLASLPHADPLPPYVRLIHDAIDDDRSLFTRPDGLGYAWDAITDVLSDPPTIHSYEPKSWGPKEADELTGGDGWILRS